MNVKAFRANHPDRRLLFPHGSDIKAAVDLGVGVRVEAVDYRLGSRGKRGTYLPGLSVPRGMRFESTLRRARARHNAERAEAQKLERRLKAAAAGKLGVRVADLPLTEYTCTVLSRRATYRLGGREERSGRIVRVSRTHAIVHDDHGLVLLQALRGEERSALEALQPVGVRESTSPYWIRQGDFFFHPSLLEPVCPRNVVVTSRLMGSRHILSGEVVYEVDDDWKGQEIRGTVTAPDHDPVVLPHWHVVVRGGFRLESAE